MSVRKVEINQTWLNATITKSDILKPGVVIGGGFFDLTTVAESRHPYKICRVFGEEFMPKDLRTIAAAIIELADEIDKETAE